MATKMPPVPDEQRSPKGTGADPATVKPSDGATNPVPDNADQQGRQGNSKQNTTNQGYQQDR